MENLNSCIVCGKPIKKGFVYKNRKKDYFTEYKTCGRKCRLIHNKSKRWIASLYSPEMFEIIDSYCKNHKISKQDFFMQLVIDFFISKKIIKLEDI